jgi:hypothetical protein
MDGVGSSDSLGGSMGGFDSVSFGPSSPGAVDTGPNSFDSGSSFDSEATALTGATDSFASTPDPFATTPLGSDPFAPSADPFGSSDLFAPTGAPFGSSDPFASTANPFENSDPFALPTSSPFDTPPTIETGPFGSTDTTAFDSTPATDLFNPAPSLDALAPSPDLYTPSFMPVSFMPSYTAFDPGTNGSTLSEAADASRYSPDKSGWHDYTAGPNLVCSAELACTPQEIADQLARFSVPGQDPAAPAVNNGTYFVTDPRTDLPGGWVTTNISPDGLTVTNTTQRAHVFYDGQIVRSASRADDGSWYVTTHGFGNNVIPGAATVNQSQGPEIFNYMDQQMKANIEAHHGR